MFEPGKILKRAVQIVWNYKVLWIFGFLIALTGGAGNSGGGGSSNFSTSGRNNFNGWDNFGQSGQYNSPQMQKIGDWFQANVAPLFATEAKAITTTFIIVGIIFGVALIFGLLSALVRYPAETAVIRMVDAHEQTGTKVKFSEGWRMGWNKRAWKIFLIDLLIGTPAFAIVAVLVGGLSVYLIRNSSNISRAMTPAVWVWIGLVVFLLMALGLLMLVVSVLRQFVIRKAALEEMGVRDSFRHGWTMFKQNLKHAFLMWLILIAVGIGVGIAMVLAALILIPAYALLTIPGIVVAAIPGAIGYGITSLFAGQVLSWIIAAMVAIPFFFIIVFSPLVLLSGGYAVFQSNVWTLLYRQKITALQPPTDIPQVTEVPPLPAQ